MIEIKVPKPRKLDSGNWFIQIRRDGASYSITDADEKKCIARAQAIKMGILQKEEEPEKITLEKAIDNYTAARSNIISPCTLRVYKSIKKNHFSGLMKTDVNKITRQMLQDAINVESKENSPKTVRNAYGLVTAVISDYRKIDLSRIILPQKAAKGRTVLSKADLKKLYKEVENTDIECQVLLASWLGMRRSEILALTWDAIDTEKNTIEVKAAMVPGENGMVIKGTKTEKSTRLLHTDKYLIDKLSAIERRAYTDLIFGATATTMTNHLNAACDRAGLPHIGFHALRHTNASVMLSLNVPDKYAMERGGWSSTSTMKYIYQHTMDDERESVNSAVDNYFKEVAGIENANGSANAK